MIHNHKMRKGDKLNLNTYFPKIVHSIFLIGFILLLVIANPAFADRLATSVPRANIRSGPGTGYDILWEVEKYHPLLIIKKTDKWYKFRDFEGDEGWIFESLVKKITTVITIKKNCNIRSGSSTKSKIVFTAEKGIPFKVIKKKGNWINIQHTDGDKGWIHKSLVW